MKKLINQIERHHHYFPDFTHVLWFKEINKESEFYFELKSKYPFLMIVDNIEDFKAQYEIPIEYFYINSQNTLWSMIAEKNDFDFSEILKRTRISQITIDAVRAFVDNKIEESKLDLVEELAIITDEKDPNDILINPASKLSETFPRKEFRGEFNIPEKTIKTFRDVSYNKFRYVMDIQHVKKSSNVFIPKFVVPGYFEKCLVCSKIWTMKLIKDGICDKCSAFLVIDNKCI
jgi:hypothetical protein